MDDYFKSWRRKIGVVTLAMAFVFMAGWSRSCLFRDAVTIYTKHTVEDVLSLDGVLYLGHVTRINGVLAVNVKWKVESEFAVRFRPIGQRQDLYDTEKMEWPHVSRSFLYKLNNMRMAPRMDSNGMTFKFDQLIIPYWSAVFPLTLISAYLLLSKPRVMKPKTVVENRIHE